MLWGLLFIVGISYCFGWWLGYQTGLKEGREQATLKFKVGSDWIDEVLGRDKRE